MQIENELKLDFKDVLLRPKRSTLASRNEVTLTRTFTFRHSSKTWQGVPIVASNMDTTGTLPIAQALAKEGMMTCLHKYHDLETLRTQADLPVNHIALTSGSGQADFAQLEGLVEAFPQVQFLCLDVANGYSQAFLEFVKKARSVFPQHIIVAGNVVTREMTEALVLAGADIVKVGIGPGSVCTTRKMTGVGYPQLSAIIECADSAHGLGGHVMADGGCTVPGDIAKAFGAGADFVMLGGMLAGHTESGGELIERDGQQYKAFYGMSSKTAMGRYVGGVAEYRAAEGKTVELPYRGPVKDTLQEVLGGVRSACTYVGARTLKDLPKCTTFVRVTQQINDIYS